MKFWNEETCGMTVGVSGRNYGLEMLSYRALLNKE